MHILSVIVFLVLIALTLIVTARAAKKVRTDKDFYAAGGDIPGWQNGLAIAGEFMASGAFLGIAGLIAFHGLDGEIFSICWFASFFVVLILVAEVIRNSGKYTFIDIVSYRLNQKSIRPAVAITVFIVSLTYLIPQMVAAGALSKILFGISDTVGILVVGGLMIVYVVLGGMMAATWIQSLKAILLLAAGYVLAWLTMSHFDFSISNLFDAVANSPELGEKWIQQGGWLKNPIERYSLGLSLLFGTAAMPHVLMRLFTVKSKEQAQKSALWTMLFMGMFHMNVAYLSGLAFSIAATVNLPTIILALYWKRLTTTGALIGIIGGTVISLFAVLTGPSIMGANAIFPLNNPGIVTIPLGFLITVIASLLTADKVAEQKYVELSVRSHSGLGAE